MHAVSIQTDIIDDYLTKIVWLLITETCVHRLQSTTELNVYNDPKPNNIEWKQTNNKQRFLSNLQYSFSFSLNQTLVHDYV